MKFMQSFELNILQRDIKLALVLDTLMQLVQGEAERVVSRVLAKVWMNMPKFDRVNLGEDAFTTWLTVYETKNLSAKDWEKLVRDDKKYEKMVLDKVVFHLRCHYFKTNFTGSNALKRHTSWIRSLRFDPNNHGTIQSFVARAIRYPGLSVYGNGGETHVV